MYDSTFDTPYGEYMVLTDDEADETHRNFLESLIDDIGIKGIFGYGTWQWNYVVGNFLEDNGITDYMNEDYRSYFEDIESENNDLFGNRQIEEVVTMLANNGNVSFSLEEIVEYLKHKDLNEESLKEELEELSITLDTFDSIKEFFEKYDDNNDEYIEKCIEIIISEYDNPAEWVVSNFGNDQLTSFIKDGYFSVDIDGISQWVIDIDGRGPGLAGWD